MSTVAHGRFAPSPTGAPHFGTLLGALASYLHARATGAKWLVRIEDLDQVRLVEGAADEMLRTLEAFGMTWDGQVMYQSERISAYKEILETLTVQGHVYPCGCTRRDFIDGKYGPEGPVYPGTCRSGISEDKPVRSYRLKVEDRDICFADLVQGRICQNLSRDIGDFIVKRADGFFAYQLAVVVDDAYQGITQVVRGADLLGSTQRQIHLQQLLGYPTPEYLHIPVVLGTDGKKLSKSEDAPAIDIRQPEILLYQALSALGHQPPDSLSRDDLLQWAIKDWQPANILKVTSLSYETIQNQD